MASNEEQLIQIVDERIALKIEQARVNSRLACLHHALALRSPDDAGVDKVVEDAKKMDEFVWGGVT